MLTFESLQRKEILQRDRGGKETRTEWCPRCQRRTFRKDGGQWDQNQRQVRERLEIFTGFGGMEVIGDLCQSCSHRVRGVEGATSLWGENKSGVRKQKQPDYLVMTWL